MLFSQRIRSVLKRAIAVDLRNDNPCERKCDHTSIVVQGPTWTSVRGAGVQCVVRGILNAESSRR